MAAYPDAAAAADREDGGMWAVGFEEAEWSRDGTRLEWAPPELPSREEPVSTRTYSHVLSTRLSVLQIILQHFCDLACTKCHQRSLATS